MYLLAIWIGKLTRFMLRLTRRRGTSFPGKVALAIAPRLLHRLGGKLERCVVVTGTNGKTTTSSLLAGMLSVEEPIIHNTEGANLPQGLTSAVLQHTNWFGRLRRKTALFEIDEATLPRVTKALPIKVLVVTNVFRDQLDRYGELDTTLHKLLAGIEHTEAVVVYNGDDPLARHLSVQAAKPSRFFGLSLQHLQSTTHQQMRDGAFCMQCGHELSYAGFFYGQLGDYHCPECGFERPALDYEGHVSGENLIVSEPTLPEVSFTLPVRGLYNVYNVLAAIAAARVCGMDAATIDRGLGHYRPPLGRMQPFATTPEAILNLIKNPTGCDSVLQAILADPQDKVICIAINDLAADGRDVSWLWDADFESLAGHTPLAACVTTGYRAEDMGLRMKYAGYDPERMTVEPTLADGLTRAFAIAHEADLPVYVLSTYTALYPAATWLKDKEATADHDTDAAYRTSVS